MKNKINNKIRHCITIVTVGLFMFLAVLRITGTIALSWWWVASPVWIPVALALILVILFLGLVGFYSKKVK